VPKRSHASHVDIAGAVFGSTLRNYLQETLFELDGVAITRDDLVSRFGVGHFIAARKLGDAMRRLKIKTTRDLYRIDPLSLIRNRGIGERTLFVAMCILDEAGQSPIEWWNQNFDTKFATASHAARAKKIRRTKARDAGRRSRNQAPVAPQPANVAPV